MKSIELRCYASSRNGMLIANTRTFYGIRRHEMVELQDGKVMLT